MLGIGRDSIHSYTWANVSGRWVVRLTWLLDRPDSSYEEIDNWRTSPRTSDRKDLGRSVALSDNAQLPPD